MPTKVEISHKTIIFTIALLAGLWFLFQIREIVFLLFISFIIMSGLRPIIEALTRLRVPRILSIILIYGLVFGILGTALVGAIPSLVTQTTKLVSALPRFTERISPYWQVDDQWITQQITPIGENVVRVSVGIFSNVITVITVLVFTFYFLLERKRTETMLMNISGAQAATRVLHVVQAIEDRLGAWVLGQICLMVFIGMFVYGGLTLLHIEYALPLALLAGLLEIVPTIGPIISAVPAIIIAFAISPLLSLSVAALYFIINQVENVLVVPMIMKRSVGLSPLVTIVSLMVGGKLAGVIGVILSVPVVLVLQEVFRAFISSPASKPLKEK